MQRTRSLHLLEFAADLGHAVADQSPVGFDLGLARPAEEAEPAALTLEVSPAAHQPAGLIFEMGKLDLQLAFGGGRPFAENLEDQPGPVDHLGADFLFE